MTTVFTNSRGQQVLSITQDGGAISLNTTATDGVFARFVEIVGDFSHIDNLTKSGSFTTPTISLDGKTLTFEFATANKARFNETESFGFDFSGTGMESAVAHIQGSPWGSEKITGAIPEPGVIFLGVAGLILILLRRRP